MHGRRTPAMRREMHQNHSVALRCKRSSSRPSPPSIFAISLLYLLATKKKELLYQPLQFIHLFLIPLSPSLSVCNTTPPLDQDALQCLSFLTLNDPPVSSK